MSNVMVHHAISNCDPNKATAPELTPLLLFTRSLGKTAPTIWRWRKAGMLDGIINICGKPYITAAGINKFHRRAKAGEFAKPDHAPRREKSELP